MTYFLISKVKSIWPVLVIFGFLLILFLANYKPDSYLTGWDNLHPEFNAKANLKRSIFAVWQEYQGLGLLGGMGHASDLIHQTIMFLLSWIIPDSLLRYTWVFLMLFLGPLGVYFLLCKIIIPHQRKIWPLLGALFYLLNLATVQTFYAPFEAFIAHYASLPWLLSASFLYFKKPTKKNLILFVTVLILSTPAAYIPTLFVVYIFSLVILFVSITCVKFLRIRTLMVSDLRKFLKIFFIVFLVNAFWLLPFFYFTFTNSYVTLDAKINQISTESIFLRNKEFGNIWDVALLKGFWFNNIEPDLNGQFTPILQPWREHLNNSVILFIGYALFTIVVTGLIKAIKTKRPALVAFGMLSLFAFTMLATNTQPFSLIDELFRKIRLFDQAFRFPFTKFSVLATLTFSVFFPIGVKTIVEWLQRKTRKPLVLPILLIGFTVLVLLALPAFQGKLLYQKETIRIPDEYFKLFNFFQSKNINTRIANFPQQTFWGWNYYSWGYGGSGFLWYGIEQPILDRAFDVWSSQNENYYWEMSYALYSQNLELFEKVLEKYQVNWLLLDENIINPTSPKALYADELKGLVAQSRKIEQGRVFGKITVYKVNLETSVKDFVFLKNNLPTIAPAYSWNNYDPAFLTQGHYKSLFRNSKLEIRNSVYYPFRSLFTGKNQEDIEFDIQETDDSFKFVADVPAVFRNANLILPDVDEKLLLVDSEDLSNQEEKAATINFSGEKITVIIPKVAGYLSSEINGDKEILLQNKEDNQAYWLPNLPHDRAYIITVQSRNLNGQPAVFWLENLNSRRPDIETYLAKTKEWTTSYFIQPPMEEDGLGYTIHIDNIPVGSDKPVNEIGKITVHQIPLKLLTHLSLQRGDYLYSETIPSFQEPVSVEHPNPSLYKIVIGNRDSDNPKTLVLSQSFDKGWVAYNISSKFPGLAKRSGAGKVKSSKFSTFLAPIIGVRLKNHVLVNNWANGWILPDGEQDSTIALVYLPQYLEYAGFVLLFATLGFIIFPKSGKI